MVLFGKKELEAKQREVNEAREEIRKLTEEIKKLTEEKQTEIKNLSEKIEEMHSEAVSKDEEIALKKQQLEHEKELFDSHQSEREKALKLQEEQMGKEIDARRKMLESQKADFDEHLQKLTEEYNAKMEELEKKTVELETQKLDFEPKLREAKKDFAQKRAETERKIEERITETSQENLKRQEEFDRKLHDAHQKSEEEHENLLLEQTNKRLAETDKELAERRNLLAKEEHEFRERNDEKEKYFRDEKRNLQDDRDRLNKDLRDYEQKNASQEAQQKFLENRKAALDKEAQELAEARINELTAQLKNYKAQHDRLSEERAALEIQVNAFNEIKTRLNGEEPEIILLKIQALEKQIASLKEKLAQYPEDVEKTLDSKQEEIETLTDQLEEYKEKYRTVQNLAATAEISELTNLSLESQKKILQQDNERLETLNAEQAETIKRYRELYDKAASYEEKIKSVMAPHDNFTAEKIRREALVLEEPEVPETPAESENAVMLSEAKHLEEKDSSVADLPQNDSENPAEQAESPANWAERLKNIWNNLKTSETPEETASTENAASAETEANPSSEENAESEKKPEPEFFNPELKWLENVSKKISDYGLSFSQRILYAFHTALKTAEWSPLAVLAGVSGTGKSELPQLYAKFGGINCVNIPVQPNWDSQESLLGYYNTVSSKFEAQPLLQFLVQTQLDHADDPEKDTSLKDQLNIVLLDEMNLAHIEQYFAEFLSKLEERRGKKEDNPQFPHLSVKLGGTDSYPLPLGRNVLWVGTMNQDETTKSLSDKVLDRGIVINFPRPNSFKRRVELNSSVEAEEKYLSAKTWDSWKMDLTRQQIEDSEKIIAPYKEFVEEINKAISNIGRAIGHRVWQSIENYIWNYPTVRDFILRHPKEFVEETFAKDLQGKIDPAFEDQLVQKIMPKLRGIETRGESKKVLEEIRNKIEKFKGEGHALNITKDFENAIKFGDGQFLWVTSEYLTTENENQ